jgi:hypothetical protein
MTFLAGEAVRFGTAVRVTGAVLWFLSVGGIKSFKFITIEQI